VYVNRCSGIRQKLNVAHVKGEEKCVQGKPEGKRTLGGPRRRWEEHTKLVLKKWRSWTGLIWFSNRERLL
jgi:hypothetical protein